MKKILLNIALLLAVNAVGFFILPLIIVLSIKFGLFPHVPDGPLLHQFSVWLTMIGPLISIPASFFSIGYIFSRTELRFWLLLTPLYVPAIYIILLLTYFTFRI